MATDSKPLPPNYRWNFAAFVVDYASFLIGFGFISSVTVLPAFVRQLTTSAPLVGLASTIFRAGWTLPQLATAHLIKDKPRKKPFFYMGLPLRATVLIIALALWAGLASNPTAMLVLFFACMGLLALSDGFISLVWFDIMARAIPARRRGRMVGTSQFIGGLGGIGVGVLIGMILGQWAFPTNYALLFLCAAGGMAVSTVALLLIREPPPDPAPDEAQGGQAFSVKLMGRDRDFRRLMLCRTLVGMTSLATPFFVGHAADVMGLPESVIGRFVIANTIGSLAASVILGYVSERRGTRFIIHLSSAVAVVGPLFALIVHLARVDWLTQAYPVAYVALGISMSAWMLGFTNYMLEIAPPHIRPSFVGLGNTLMGLMAFVPAVGGWLLQTTSYTVLFATATVLTFAGFVLTFTLRSSQTIVAGRAQS